MWSSLMASAFPRGFCLQEERATPTDVRCSHHGNDGLGCLVRT